VKYIKLKPRASAIRRKIRILELLDKHRSKNKNEVEPLLLTLHLFPGKDENLHNIFEGSRFEAGALASAFFAGLLAFDG
jgi:hypothetical protein